MLKNLRQALRGTINKIRKITGDNIYFVPLSQEVLQLAQTYVRGFPFMIYDTVNEMNLELAGVKVERPRTSQAILEEIKNSYFIKNNQDKLPSTEQSITDILTLDVPSYLKEGCSTLIGVKNCKKFTRKDVSLLSEKLKNGYLCWDLENRKETVLGHLEDIKKGGCFLFIVESEKHSNFYAFNRLYVLIDNEGNKELFWDTIEGKHNYGCFEDWTRSYNRTAALALSVFTSVAIAQQTKAKRLYFPEDEIRQFFAKLISTNKWPFKREKGEKIGIQPDSNNKIKPYFYHLGRLREEFPYIPIYDVILEDYAKKAQQLSRVLSSFERGIETEKTQNKIKACMNGLEIAIGLLQVYQEGFKKQLKTLQEMLFYK
jgi:hypothetical protein